MPLSPARSRQLLLAIILLAAGYLRFTGIDWGLPHHLHSDEDVMMYWSLQMRDIQGISGLTEHQYFYVYGPLPLYWTALGGSIINRVHPIGPGDPAVITALYIWARLLSAILGTLTVWIVYLLGQTLGNPFIALSGAALTAFFPVHIQNSHYFTAEIPFTFFASLCLYFVIRNLKDDRSRWPIAAGLALGLTLLCKYTAVFLIPVIVISPPAFGIIRLRSFFKSGRTMAAVLVPLVAGSVLFFCLNPWILFNPRSFLRTYAMLKDWSSGIQQPLWTAQFTGLPRGWYWFTDLIPTGFSLPVLGAALLGLVFWLVSRDKQWGPVILFGISYFILVGFSRMQYIRYIVPMTPVMALGAAGGLNGIGRLLQQRKPVKLLFHAVLIAVMAPTAFKGLATANIYNSADTRLEAAEWIRDRYPPGTVILMDNSAFRPPVEDRLQRPRLNQNFVLRGHAQDEFRDRYSIRLLDVYNHLYRTDLPNAEKERYLQSRMRNVDVIVFGEEAVVQYRKIRDRHPVINRFYDELFQAAGPFEPVRTFRHRPGVDGLHWNDEDAELTWRLFDHPVIWVFEKKEL